MVDITRDEKVSFISDELNGVVKGGKKREDRFELEDGRVILASNYNCFIDYGVVSASGTQTDDRSVEYRNYMIAKIDSLGNYDDMYTYREGVVRACMAEKSLYEDELATADGAQKQAIQDRLNAIADQYGKAIGWISQMEM